MRITTTSLALLVAALGAAPLAAQDSAPPRASLGLLGGPLYVSTTGFAGEPRPDGTAIEVGATYVRRLRPWLAFETGLTYTGYDLELLDETIGGGTQDLLPRADWFALDVGLQAQLPTAGWQPFVGIGIGPAWLSELGEPSTGRIELNLTGVAGVRGPIGGRWRGRAEVRARSFDPWSDRLVGVRVGVEYVLRP